MNLESSQDRIRVAFGSEWISIHPGLQHTLVADLVLSNQFEALVGADDFGAPIPLGALSWSVSEDSKVFTFSIDTARRFSDGSFLSASDFKRSWEDALRLEPKSANSSLLDVLYKIKGFEDFEKTGQIRGIQTPNANTLVIEFSSPFRMALDHLQGNRFSAYKQSAGKYIGTGKYIISEVNDGSLLMDPNPWASENLNVSPLEIKSMDASMAIDRLRTGDLDVFGYSVGADIPNALESDKDLAVVPGQDAIHQSLAFNMMPGRIFESRIWRRAVQFIVVKALRNNPELLGNTKLSEVDPQVYLPMQAGRIPESEVNTIVMAGEKYLDELVQFSLAHPIVIFYGVRNKWVVGELKKCGINVSEKSREVGRKEFFTVLYKTLEPDILMAGFSVASGDPDGIYHRLGKNGAIVSPMSYSETVAKLLESGRKIADRELIDPHYQKVNKAILEEAPFVHLGFSKAVAVYRSDRISMDNLSLKRNQGHLHIYHRR